MLHRAFKYTLIQITGGLLTVLLMVTVFSGSAYGKLDPGDGGGPVEENYSSYCRDKWYEGDPNPIAILCPIARLLNVFVLSAGALFVIFIFLSALKFAMAQGDPKALQAAKQSLTLAVIGMIVVIGVYAILTILGNIFGIKQNLIKSPFDTLGIALENFLHKLNIFW